MTHSKKQKTNPVATVEDKSVKDAQVKNVVDDKKLNDAQKKEQKKETRRGKIEDKNLKRETQIVTTEIKEQKSDTINVPQQPAPESFNIQALMATGAKYQEAAIAIGAPKCPSFSMSVNI